MGWPALMALAWVLSFLVLLTDPRAAIYPAYGPGLNWVLGLPCWLLGSRLAERLDSFCSYPVSVIQIWMWRGVTWMLSSLSCILRFHTPIGYPWTLNLFAVFATLWLEREIRFYNAGRNPLFEKLGEASYSLYLTHFSSTAILHALPVAAAKAPGAKWFASMLLCGSVACLFYWLVERPSHRFARRFTKQATWLGVTSPFTSVQLSSDQNRGPVYVQIPVQLERGVEDTN
jgi:peptidoglycan/LPS O-acetylase OafA/YrhL